jgi:hypothetical protein
MKLTRLELAQVRTALNTAANYWQDRAEDKFFDNGGTYESYTELAQIYRDLAEKVGA